MGSLSFHGKCRLYPHIGEERYVNEKIHISIRPKL